MQATAAEPYAIFSLRDGRQLYREKYRGHAYLIWHETVEEALDERGAEGEGWSAVVTIDREPWRDYPATCCATYDEAVQAVRDYIDEEGAS